jgi:hypothetical protein
MAGQLVMKNTFWELEMTPEELESTVHERRQRAYTDMCFGYKSSLDLDLDSPADQSLPSTDLGSPTSTALRSSPASSGGSVAGDASDRWADICDSDDDLPSPRSPPSAPSALPSRPAGTWFLPPASTPLETHIAVAMGKAKERAAVEAKNAGGKGKAQNAEKQQQPQKQKSTCPPCERTTLVLHKLPKTMTRTVLLEKLDMAGLKGLYDLVYLPMDFKKGMKCFGYAIINFVDHERAEQANSHFGANTDWSESHQGLVELIQRYRDSPIMHPSMPDASKPIMFSNGLVAPFPSPTKEIEPFSKN